MMASIPFDTLQFSEKLRAAGFTDTQAKAQAEALAEIITDEGLRAATASEMRLAAAIAEAKNELIRWVVGVVVSVGILQTALVTGLILKAGH